MTTAVRRTRAMELIWKVHAFLYRVSGGRVGGRLGALPVLLLTVRGRKSGEPRTVALNYVQEGDSYAVFASHAGLDRDPPWWLNLRDAGGADVQIGSRHQHVRVREAQGDERDRLWAAVTKLDPAYDVYQKRTRRRIAAVVLEPA